MNLARWTWALVWAVCLAFDLVDAFTAALSGMARPSTYGFDAVLGAGYLAMLVVSVCRAVRDVDRCARTETRLATVRAVVHLLAAREGNA